MPVPLRGRQRANLLLVMVTAQAVQVALVGVVVWAFFVIFGAVAISIARAGGLARRPGRHRPADLVEPRPRRHAVSSRGWRPSSAGFAGFYATVYAASDSVYRAHFSERITTDLERALAVRRAYLARPARATTSAPTRPRRRRQASDLRRSSHGGTWEAAGAGLGATGPRW